MRRILASIAVVSIAACGGDRAASKNAAPSVTADIPPAPAKPAAPVSVSTVTVTDAGVAVAAEPEIDPSTAEGAARWLASLCAHANAKDTSWVVAHVSPLIRGSAIHARENGELQLERLISYGPNRFREDLVRDVGTDGSICDVLKLPASAITGFTDDSISASGLFRAPNVSYRFAITKGEPALLSGLAVDLPPHPMPKRAKKHAFEIITDTIQETGAQTSAVSPWVAKTIQREPQCVDEELTKEEKRVLVFVHVAKKDGEPATAGVFPADVVSASVVACLTDELSFRAAYGFKGAGFDVDVIVSLVPTIGAPAGSGPTITLTKFPPVP